MASLPEGVLCCVGTLSQKRWGLNAPGATLNHGGIGVGERLPRPSVGQSPTVVA